MHQAGPEGYVGDSTPPQFLQHAFRVITARDQGRQAHVLPPHPVQAIVHEVQTALVGHAVKAGGLGHIAVETVDFLVQGQGLPGIVRADEVRESQDREFPGAVPELFQGAGRSGDVQQFLDDVQAVLEPVQLDLIRVGIQFRPQGFIQGIHFLEERVGIHLRGKKTLVPLHVPGDIGKSARLETLAAGGFQQKGGVRQGAEFPFAEGPAAFVEMQQGGVVDPGLEFVQNFPQVVAISLRFVVEDEVHGPFVGRI